ncbi:MAG: hypothetical protein ACREET_12440 [Stellaceae bacterium]
MRSSVEGRLALLSPLAHRGKRLRKSHGHLSLSLSILVIVSASLMLWAILAAAIFELIELV